MTKIKICGLTRNEDIGIINQLRPDYAGFVFAESFRQVTINQAFELKRILDPQIPAVGVFVNESVGVIETLCNSGIIDVVQLHGNETSAYMEKLKQRMNKPVMKAIRVKTREQIEEADSLPCDFLLLDTYVRGQYGGCGITFDRSIIPPLKKSFFLAGGLNADNVCQAIGECRPYGVDVSSAMETDGFKDRDKIQAFIERIREHE